MKNTKKIILEIPNENVLKLINSTPSLRRLFIGELKVGWNNQTVNHKQFYDITRTVGVIGCRLFA